MSAACAAMSVATVASPRACAPPVRGSEVAELQLDPVDGVAPTGPVPVLPSSDRVAGEVLRRADRRVRSSAPDSASRSSANWRMVSNCRYRVRVAVWSATTSDLRTNESRWRSTSTSSPRSTTATTLASSKPPANTDVERSRSCSSSVSRSYDHSTVWRSVSWRSVPGAEPCNSRNRSARRSLTSTALIAAMRAAASSMPSGSPSSVSQISVTAVAVSGSRRPKSGRTARARSTKRVTASEDSPPSTASGATVNADFAVEPEDLARRGEDLDARETAPGSRRAPTRLRSGGARSCPPRGARCRPRSVSAIVSTSGVSPCGVMPNTVAIAAGTEVGSPTDASSTSHTPSGNSPATSAPTSRASRDLPTPPTPVSVTSEFDRTSSATSRDDRLATDQRGQLLREVAREVVDAAEHREVDREPVGDDLVHRHAAVPTAEPVLAERPQRARGRAAAPRSCRRRAPDRRVPTTTAARRGSPRCPRSVRSRSIASPVCRPMRTLKSTTWRRRAAAPAPRSAAVAASAALENAAEKPSPSIPNT